MEFGISSPEGEPARFELLPSALLWQGGMTHRKLHNLAGGGEMVGDRIHRLRRNDRIAKTKTISVSQETIPAKFIASK